MNLNCVSRLGRKTLDGVAESTVVLWGSSDLDSACAVKDRCFPASVRTWAWTALVPIFCQPGRRLARQWRLRKRIEEHWIKESS